jgi:Tfp pilus assembly protein PilV
MTMRLSKRRGGVVLLEVLVALVILATAGMAAVSFIDGALRNTTRALERDAIIRAANDHLDAIALWSRTELDRQLGTRVQGAWRVVVDRPWISLYVVSIVDRATEDTLVATSLYRPLRQEPHDGR